MCSIAIAIIVLLAGIARADEPADRKTEVVAGSVLLGIGVSALAGAGVVWGLGAGRDGDPMGIAIGSSVTALGIGAFVPAAVLLPLGLVRTARYKRAHHVALPLTTSALGALR